MDLVDLCLVRTEGLNIDSSVLGCYVTLNSQLCDVITPLAPESRDNRVQLMGNGLLELVVKEMGANEDKKDMVSVDSSLLHGEVWLPLNGQTYLTELPREVTGKKILVSVGGIREPCSKRVSCASDVFEQFKSEVTVSCQTENDPTDSEQTLNELGKLQYENCQLKTLLSSYEQQLDIVNLKQLQEEIDSLRNKLEISEKSRLSLETELNRTLSAQFKDKFRTRSQTRLSWGLKTSSSIQNSHRKSPLKRVDETEAALRTFLAKFKVQVQFVRESENIYSVNKRKVFITLKNGLLLCRTGGGFMGIQQFLDSLRSSRSPNRQSPLLRVSPLRDSNRSLPVK